MKVEPLNVEIKPRLKKTSINEEFFLENQLIEEQYLNGSQKPPKWSDAMS
jgi:hypothetical protein